MYAVLITRLRYNVQCMHMVVPVFAKIENAVTLNAGRKRCSYFLEISLERYLDCWS